MSCLDNEKRWEVLYSESLAFTQNFIDNSVSGLASLTDDSRREISEFIVNQMLIELRSYDVDTATEYPIVDNKTYPEGER